MQADRARHLPYERNRGFRTADLALPFKMLAAAGRQGNQMLELDGPISNQLFDVLADWNTALGQYEPQLLDAA